MLFSNACIFLCAALVRRLLKEGHRVRLFDNDFRGSVDTIGDILDQMNLCGEIFVTM
jgi:nucleoside-diphosphate-sugar epimerase